MAVNVNLNGITYSIPNTGETGWGDDLTSYLTAIASGGILTLEAGAFPITNELNIGPTFGLLSPYYKSGQALPSTAGVFRLTNTEALSWRNGANTGNLALTVVGDALTFDGAPVGGGSSLPRITVTGTSQMAVSGNMYILTNVAATTVTLPLAPSAGNIVFVVPTNGLKTNVIDPNGQTIANVAGSMTLDNPAASVELQFLNNSWRFII